MTGEDFSGKGKSILLPLQKTVAEPNAECCILVCLALFRKRKSKMGIAVEKGS